MVVRKDGVWQELKRNKLLFLMLFPGVLYFFIFQYVPMSGIVLAFKNYTYSGGIFGSEWNGWANFDFFFRSGKAWIITRNTILYNVAFMVTGLVLQLATAIFIAEIGTRFVKKYIQSSLLFPFFISWVVVGAFIYNLFSFELGTINYYMRAWGFEPIDFYGNTEVWSYILVFFNNWKYVGYNSLIYLAAIMGIDKSLYEAADIDGASIWQRARLITLPLLTPTIMILMLLAVGHLFRGNFELFYNVIGTNGLLYDQTDVIDTYVFRSLIQSPDIGMSSAAGLYQAVLCLVVILITNYVIRKYNPDYALF
ncbi:ABC transporter permease subunit [Paenibacillus sp. PL2-23]|uniref:ABC transporter permease n=1 Tax=Paenibacillus sp. PL2-23 TaxID=2100729 RepID=UPI0030FB2D85